MTNGGQSMIDTGCFYVFENRPVAIKEILHPVSDRLMVRIRHIQRTLKDKQEDVFFDCLQILTPELAEEIIEKYNRTIGECNVRIHAFNECLRYM
jgi:hypothetical protein